jgi:hypothetical protein
MFDHKVGIPFAKLSSTNSYLSKPEPLQSSGSFPYTRNRAIGPWIKIPSINGRNRGQGHRHNNLGLWIPYTALLTLCSILLFFINRCESFALSRKGFRKSNGVSVAEPTAYGIVSSPELAQASPSAVRPRRP